MAVRVTAEISERFIAARHNERLTQLELSERARISLRSIKDLESGRREYFNEDTIIRICRVLNIEFGNIKDNLEQKTETTIIKIPFLKNIKLGIIRTNDSLKQLGSTRNTRMAKKLKIFLSYASQDKDKVRELCSRLEKFGFVDIWFDEKSLFPGHAWELEIAKAVKKSDIIMVCLSTSSITKEGYFQKEIKLALDAADLQPEGTIFVIPVRLDACEVPSRLKQWQWIDLFGRKEMEKLKSALLIRYDDIIRKH